jgi:lipoprotein-anchoring transpeptidase ErfK/SrfK
MRINRMNTQLYAGLRIAVPDNLAEADIMDFAPFPAQMDTSGEKVIVVDPIARAFGAYDESGTLLRWGPVSAGADWCRDIDEACHTHPGSFRIFTLGSSTCYSTKFPLPNGGAPMPYCMYFNNGQALHGEPNGLPGYNASHGCVRLYVNDAEWLRYDFVNGPTETNAYRGTRVVVKAYEKPEEDEIEEEPDSVM